MVWRESKAAPNSYKIQKARMNRNLYIIIFIKKRGQAGRRALPNLKPYRIGGHPAQTIQNWRAPGPWRGQPYPTL